MSADRMTHVEWIRSLLLGYAQQEKAAGNPNKAEEMVEVVVAFDLAREQLARTMAARAGKETAGKIASYLADLDLIDQGRVVCECDDTGLVWSFRHVDPPADPPRLH